MNDMDRMRARLSKGKPKGRSFTPPELTDFAVNTSVLAFDPTLSNCGWVTIEIYEQAFSGGLRFMPIERGTIRPSSASSGFTGTWEKAKTLNDELAKLIFHKSLFASAVICETPWVGSGGHRTESALIAGTLVYLYSGELFRPVSAQHAYAVLCGGRRPPTAQAKKDIALSVARYIPESSGRGWNEHQRDAAALALTYLHDLKGEHDGR